MTLTDVVSLFDSTVSRQMTYWNVYWVVAVGILAFLWKEPRDKALKITLVVGFITFWLSNLYIVASLQVCLVDIASAVQDYLKSDPREIPSKLRPALSGVKAVSLPLVIGFHLFVSAAFTVAMLLSRTADHSRTPNTNTKTDE